MNNRDKIEQIVENTREATENLQAALKIIQQTLDFLKANPKAIHTNYDSITRLVQSTKNVAKVHADTVAIYAHQAASQELHIKTAQLN